MQFAARMEPGCPWKLVAPMYTSWGTILRMVSWDLESEVHKCYSSLQVEFMLHHWPPPVSESGMCQSQQFYVRGDNLGFMRAPDLMIGFCCHLISAKPWPYLVSVLLWYSYLGLLSTVIIRKMLCVPIDHVQVTPGELLHEILLWINILSNTLGMLIFEGVPSLKPQTLWEFLVIVSGSTGCCFYSLKHISH